MQKFKRLNSMPLLAASLLLLSGCEWFTGPAKTEQAATIATPAQEVAPAAPVIGGDEVLLKIKGEPRITLKGFQEYKNKFGQAQPQYAPLLEDPTIEEQIFMGQKNEALISEWAKEQNLDKDSTFQKELQDLMEYARRGLYVKHFQEANPVKVSDSEIKQYYDENKNTPQLMVSAGGVQADSVTFDTKDKADAFLKKAKEKGATKFADAAKEANVSIKKLGQVSKHSFDVEGPLREKIMAVKTFPTIDMVPVKDKFVVFVATEKKEPEYVPFADVKEGIRNFLEQQKSAANMMERLGKLEKDYKVESSDYFERKKKAQQEKQQQAAQAMKQAQEKNGKPQASQGNARPQTGAGQL